jgi:hypothetical protein
VGIDLLAHYCEPPFASSEASEVFLGAAFVAVALVAVAFVAEAFLAGAFLAGAFLVGAFAGAVPVPAAALLPWARREREDCPAR